MRSHAVENHWFVATFPEKVAVREDSSDPLASVTEWVAETQPFGVFSIRVTNMRIDPFVAVGASQWIARFGNRLLGTLDKMNLAVLEDEVRDPSPGLKVRDLACRFDYEGPCGMFGRIMAVTDGEGGRVVEAWVIVAWSPAWKDEALGFLDGIKLAVSQPLWKPEA